MFQVPLFSPISIQSAAHCRPSRSSKKEKKKDRKTLPEAKSLNLLIHRSEKNNRLQFSSEEEEIFLYFREGGMIKGNTTANTLSIGHGIPISYLDTPACFILGGSVKF